MTRVVLDVDPGPLEVAVAWVPVGVEVTVRGVLVPRLISDEALFAEVGWAELRGGADWCWKGEIRKGHYHWRDRRAWHEAARILEAGSSSEPAVVYVVHEQDAQFSRGVLRAATVRVPNPRAPFPLTRRQLEAGRLAATGLSDREIGDRIGVSPGGVSGLLRRSYARAGVRDRRALADWLSDNDPAVEKEVMV